ncbi:MAG: hypothetical protein V4613_08035 [Bacteroidota bacterium]
MKNFGQAYQSIGGCSLIIAGFIAAVALSFHPSRFIPGSVLSDLWSPIHLALLIAFTLSTIGLVGIYSFLKEEASLFNCIAYIVGIVGSVWSVAIVIIEVFVLSELPTDSAMEMPLMDINLLGASLNKMQVFFYSAVFLWLWGWTMTGFALIKSKKLPSYIGTIMVVACTGMAVMTLFSGGASQMLHIVFSLFFGISWVLLGNTILKYGHTY